MTGARKPSLLRRVPHYLKRGARRVLINNWAAPLKVWGLPARHLRTLLLQVGFAEVEERPPLDYHTETEPCLRLEAHAGHDPTA